MHDAVKGGLFVAAAVATGILAGLIVPPLLGAERETAKRPREHASLAPTMPGVVGRQLDEAEDELDRRGIRYVTDAPHLVEVVMPGLLEVCESDPAPGASVRGRARLRTAIEGTCSI